MVPVRRGFWGNKIGRPHTVPCKVTGKCGSIWVGSSPLPEVLASCLHLSLRSFCRWLVSRIVTPPLVDLPELLETSLRPLMPLLLRPTPTCPPTCGRKPYSPSHLTKNSRITCPRTIAPWLLNARK